MHGGVKKDLARQRKKINSEIKEIESQMSAEELAERRARAEEKVNLTKTKYIIAGQFRIFED